ncbi:hypothetical protein EU528_06535 [Candidatus Thorarchaeota archaeon]|nr:MAG: hypothetical protein EU528_06535 [Candidatus Thorarchaeota archaeon]
MGVAFDSFIITVEYAGIVAIVLLVFCLFSRHRNDSGNLNVIQRMPVLLPAIGFVITVLLVANLGIIPMAQYEGVNAIMPHTNSGYETTFTIRDQEFYTSNLEASATYFLEYNESVHVELSVYQNESLVDILSFDILYSSIDYMSSNEGDIALSPGTYDLQLNYTVYHHGIVEGDPSGLQITISQPLVAGFTEEIVDWSSFQFGINIACILFILGGLCIGSPAKKPKKEDETDWKTTSSYEY